MTKRITALVLSLVMVFALVGTQAFAADDTDAAAALEEGLGYWFGSGPDGYDMQKAEAAFQKAADQDNAEAWYWLGVLGYYGTGAERWPQVEECFQKSADLGSGFGWYGLGRLYEEGKGFDQDYEKAAECYQKAIDAGCLLGYVGLGNLYRDGGLGEEKDGQKALEYYTKAVSADDWYTRNEARLSIGNLYYDGAQGVDLSHQKALTWYQKAADDAYPAGYNKMGLLYGWTSDVELKDYEKSLEWLEKAAVCGYPYNLALCYHYARGVETDRTRSIELFMQSADGGPQVVDSLAMLAVCYMQGEGVTRDRNAAIDFAMRCMAADGVKDISKVVAARGSGCGTALAKLVLTMLGAA